MPKIEDILLNIPFDSHVMRNVHILVRGNFKNYGNYAKVFYTVFLGKHVTKLVSIDTDFYLNAVIIC